MSQMEDVSFAELEIVSIIRSLNNIQADSLSRTFARETEWMLDRAIFKMLTKKHLYV